MSCPHGEPDPRCCLDCIETTGHGGDPVEAEVADSPPISARFPGHCPLCNLEVIAGAKVVHTTRDRWVHLSCLGGGQ